MSKSRWHDAPLSWDAMFFILGCLIFQAVAVWALFLTIGLVFDLEGSLMERRQLEASLPFLAFFALFLLFAIVSIRDTPKLMEGFGQDYSLYKHVMGTRPELAFMMDAIDYRVELDRRAKEAEEKGYYVPKKGG